MDEQIQSPEAVISFLMSSLCLITMLYSAAVSFRPKLRTAKVEALIDQVLLVTVNVWRTAIWMLGGLLIATLAPLMQYAAVRNAVENELCSAGPLSVSEWCILRGSRQVELPTLYGAIAGEKVHIFQFAVWLAALIVTGGLIEFLVAGQKGATREAKLRSLVPMWNALTLFVILIAFVGSAALQNWLGRNS